MATDFNKPVDKTNDPSYMGYSRGTDNASLQPLASVPDLSVKYVQPDYKANTTYGKLFEGLGQVGDDAVKFSDDIIKNNINDQLNKGINSIRDSFGVKAAADNADLARSIGQAGAEGAPTKLSPDGGGGGLLPQDPNLPLPLQKLGTRLSGLKEQYDQGDLSNSAYYAKQDALMSQIKQRFPGYEDQVDKMAETKLGVNPANALRSAIQSDVEKLANKVQGQNDKWTAFERTNGSTLARAYGGFEQYQKALATGQTTKAEAEAKVANLDANDADIKSRMGLIALSNADRAQKGVQARDVSTLAVTQKVDEIYTNTIKAFNIPDLGKISDDIRAGKRPLPSPDEKLGIQSNISLLMQKTDQALNTYFDTPTFDKSGHATTPRMLIGDNAAVEQIKQGAMGNLRTMSKMLLGNDDPYLFRYDADLATARQAAITNSTLKQFPQLGIAKVFKDNGGDDIASKLYEKSPEFSDPVINGLSKQNWAQIANGGYSIARVWDDQKREGINHGPLNLEQVNSAKTIIQHPELSRDPSMAPNAVEHLFGPDNSLNTQRVLAGSGPKAATAFFTGVTDQPTVKAIGKMDDQHKTMFTSWAEGAFPGVYATEAANAEQSARNNTASNSLTLNFDAKAGKFYYTGQYTSAQPIINRANSQLDGFNAAIGSMKRVWDMNGEPDVINKLYQYLPIAGIEPGSTIYSLIQREYLKAKQTNSANP